MPVFHHKSRLLNTRLELRWIRFWMRFAGLSPFGRTATWLATLVADPHKARGYLARMNPKGFISPKAVIYHSDFHFGLNIFIDDRVVLFQRQNGGGIEFGDRIHLYRDTILETGFDGHIKIGNDSSIHPRCQLNAYAASIEIGSGVMLAPNCGLYPYSHGIAPDIPIREQPLESKGSIIIGNEAWLGYGVVVLGKVNIGNGAVIGAGAVVTHDIPDNAIAFGNPAKVIKKRKQHQPPSTAPGQPGN